MRKRVAMVELQGEPSAIILLSPAVTQQNVGVGGGLEGAEMFETTLAFFEEGSLLV